VLGGLRGQPSAPCCHERERPVPDMSPEREAKCSATEVQKSRLRTAGEAAARRGKASGGWAGCGRPIRRTSPRDVRIISRRIYVCALCVPAPSAAGQMAERGDGCTGRCHRACAHTSSSSVVPAARALGAQQRGPCGFLTCTPPALTISLLACMHRIASLPPFSPPVIRRRGRDGAAARQPVCATVGSVACGRAMCGRRRAPRRQRRQQRRCGEMPCLRIDKCACGTVHSEGAPTPGPPHSGMESVGILLPVVFIYILFGCML
jgi:hypothetical protein